MIKGLNSSHYSKRRENEVFRGPWGFLPANGNTEPRFSRVKSRVAPSEGGGLRAGHHLEPAGQVGTLTQTASDTGTSAGTRVQITFQSQQMRQLPAAD